MRQWFRTAEPLGERRYKNWNTHTYINLRTSGEPGLVDRVFALHAGSRGFDSHRGHMSEQFFQSNRPGYPHPVSSELENSGIRVTVGDCSVTERRPWRPPYQTGQTVHVHAKHHKHNEDGCTAPIVCSNGSVPLSHLGNVTTRIGIHTHTHIHQLNLNIGTPYLIIVIILKILKIGTPNDPKNGTVQFYCTVCIQKMQMGLQTV